MTGGRDDSPRGRATSLVLVEASQSCPVERIGCHSRAPESCELVRRRFCRARIRAMRFARRMRRWLYEPPGDAGRCSSVDHVLTSERLVMRWPTADDTGDFLASIDPVVQRQQGLDADAIARWDDVFRATVSAGPSGCPTWLGVYDKVNGAGFAGIYFIHIADSGTTAQVGWWLGPRSRGRGLGRESLRLVTVYVHRHLAVPVLAMGTSVDNAPALAQIASTGAAHVRTAPHELPNGKVVDALWFENRDASGDGPGPGATVPGS